MKSSILILTITLTATSVWSQPVYKCPSPTPGTPPIFQQVPCPTGDGEQLKIRVAKPTGEDGLRPSERAWLDARDQYWADRAKAEAEEDREARRIAAEHHKARAAEEQADAQRETAAAQRATANAIWSLRRR